MAICFRSSSLTVPISGNFFTSNRSALELLGLLDHARGPGERKAADLVPVVHVMIDGERHLVVVSDVADLLAVRAAGEVEADAVVGVGDGRGLWIAVRPHGGNARDPVRPHQIENLFARLGCHGVSFAPGERVRIGAVDDRAGEQRLL